MPHVCRARTATAAAEREVEREVGRGEFTRRTRSWFATSLSDCAAEMAGCSFVVVHFHFFLLLYFSIALNPYAYGIRALRLEFTAARKHHVSQATKVDT